MAEETLRPNAAGDEESINTVVGDGVGTHHTVVDEAIADDGTSYVRNDAGGAYQRDLYNIADSGVGAGAINKITVHFRCQVNKIPGDKVKASIKSNVTVADGAEKILAGDETWEDFTQEWALNPDDSAAWEWADIDALQIGISLLGQAKQWADCTQVYVVVDYTLAPTKTTQYLNGNDCPVFPHGGDIQSDKLPCPPPYD